jgi:Cu2+-exporting ATPase
LLRAAAEPLIVGPGAPEACFHCGLPVAARGRRARLIDGERRSFCCPGCEAIARTIVGQGLGEYYHFREAPTGRRADGEARFDGYDDPVFQASFVATRRGTREATLILDGIRCSAPLAERQTIRTPPSPRPPSTTRAGALVRWTPGEITLSDILAAIARIGYRAFPYDPQRLEAIQRSERRRVLWRLFVAGFGMMQVMMYAVPAYIAGEGTMSPDVAQLLRWASLLLTLPVVG